MNSAYYGLRDKITSLPCVAIMLGMNTLKNLVPSFSVLTTIADLSIVLGRVGCAQTLNIENPSMPSTTPTNLVDYFFQCS